MQRLIIVQVSNKVLNADIKKKHCHFRFLEICYKSAIKTKLRSRKKQAKCNLKICQRTKLMHLLKKINIWEHRLFCSGVLTEINGQTKYAK